MAEPATYEQVCPILPSRDFDVTESFYGRLGFQTWYRDDGAYMLMNRDQVELHFAAAPDHQPGATYHGAYIRPSDIDALSDSLAALNLPRFEPAADKPWGMREATVWDPDGTVLRIGQAMHKDPE